MPRAFGASTGVAGLSRLKAGVGLLWPSIFRLRYCWSPFALFHDAQDPDNNDNAVTAMATYSSSSLSALSLLRGFDGSTQ